MSSKRKARSIGHQKKPEVRIGKAGVTEAVLKEIDRMLEDKKIVKVKLLKSVRKTVDRKALAAQVADELGAKLLGVRGGTFVLYREREKILKRGKQHQGS